MTPAVQLFQFDDAISISAVLIEGDPWFVAMDVAQALDYGDAEAMTRRLDADEKQNRRIVGFGPRGVTLINESGLYAAILGSRKLGAKRFRKWVTGTVLPSIRKTGQFQADWRRERHQCAASYKVMSELLRLTRADQGKATARHHYSNEARLINYVLCGEFKGLTRDALPQADLALLAHLEERNGILIARDVPYEARKPMLAQYAMDWRLAHGYALPAPKKQAHKAAA